MPVQDVDEPAEEFAGVELLPPGTPVVWEQPKLAERQHAPLDDLDAARDRGDADRVVGRVDEQREVFDGLVVVLEQFADGLVGVELDRRPAGPHGNCARRPWSYVWKADLIAGHHG